MANMGTNTTTTMKKDQRGFGGQMRQDAGKPQEADERRGMRGRGDHQGESAARPASKDDVVFAGLNGVSFYFQRGKTVEMPAAVAEILKNCGKCKKGMRFSF